MQSVHNDPDTICQAICSSEDSRDELSFFPLMHLPDLVLAEVAQNLDYKSLCDLMQVNRRLYELVLGNRRLWNRFKLHIEPCDHFTMPSAKRRFESVEIRGFYLYDEFHLTFALDVKQLWMIDCFSAQDKYDEFLQKMPNMEQVLVVGHHFTLVNNPRELPYDLPKFKMLRELTTNFEAFADIGAQIFKNAENLRRLDSDSDSLDLFFKLNQLKALKFNFVPNRVSIFSEDFTDQVKFRLEELFLDASEYMDEHVDVDGKQNVLAKFINLHQHHLKDLHIAVPIKSNHLKSILLNLKCLQKLYLAFQEDGLDLDPELIRQLKSSNSGVVDLNLRLNNGLVEETGVWDLQILEKFIECFPNVCALTLYFFSCNYEEKTFKISNPKLKSIDVIFECKLKVIEHLELVELNNVNLSFWCPKTSPKQWRQFFSLNPNIRNLQIVECKFSNKCFRELTTLKELERLTIQSDLLIPSEITTYTEMVWKNCPNLIEMTLEPLITPDNVWILYSPEKEDETSDEDENLVVIP